MNIVDRLAEAILISGVSISEISRKANLSRNAIYKILNKSVNSIGANTVTSICKAINVDTNDIINEIKEQKIQPSIFNFSNISKICTKKIPLLGEIACGEPIYANDDRESYVECGTDIKADFCLTAKGDSMINARIHNGDIVFCKSCEIVNNGEIAAVIIENEATLKRVYYYPEQGKLVLQAENPTFPPYLFAGEELNQIRIIGRAIAFQSDIR